MKRIRLPKNKFARLGIYIFIIVFWFFLSTFLFALLVSLLIDKGSRGDYQNAELVAAIGQIIGVGLIVGPIVFTKIILFPKSPRITRSKD